MFYLDAEMLLKAAEAPAAAVRQTVTTVTVGSVGCSGPAGAHHCAPFRCQHMSADCIWAVESGCGLAAKISQSQQQFQACIRHEDSGSEC
jgi:hypothetical protein